MSHKNRVANLLTGASLAALSFIGARVSAVAGTIPPPNAGNVTFSTLFGTNEDWVNIVAPADLGTVTNDITVSDGFDNPQTLAEDAIAVFITAGASVDTFINTANANITAIEKAFGTAYNNFSTNEATATGLRIEGDVGQVTNAGVIQGIAWAHNTESAAFAEAEAKGIEYDANQGDADEIARVINESTGNIFASAYAVVTGYGHGSNLDATAEAKGIDMFVTGLDSGLAEVINSGTILAVARASATGVDPQGGHDVDANAEAVGVEQVIVGPTTATASVDNTGSLIGASATAYAYTTGLFNDAWADATATGVAQIIEDSPNGTATVINGAAGVADATIYAYAQAYAESTADDADAEAAAAGVVQAIDAWSGGIGNVADADVTNYGSIYGSAYATAVGGEDAQAAADAAGVVQLLEDALVATADVVNSGNITGYAAALAYAGTGDATAWADGTGIIQDIDDSPDGTATVVNQAGGTIYGTAYAFASSTEDDAEADAEAAGIVQAVDAWSGGGIGTAAVAAVSNYGVIGAYATAYAVANEEIEADDADAWADAAGVVQLLEDAETANASVYNSNMITGSARALAYAEDDANADADAWGIIQDIDDSPNATASVYNAASAYIYATAYAFASSTGEDADADADAVGVDQFIDAWSDGPGERGVAQVTNYGVIAAQATAYAVANDNVIADTADANADATGVFQHVEDVGIPEESSPDAWGVAEANVDNYGIIQGYANAIAYGEDEADADADAWGVRQELDDVAAGLASVYNSPTGQILATAYAYANATDDSADADAFAVGVDQSIDAWVGGPGIKGTAEVFNDGLISAHAVAQAVKGDDDEEANADATATGIFQYVEDVGWPQDTHPDSGIALAFVDNIGTVQALATAYATAPDEADADASADGIDQEIDDSPNGYATVLNSSMVLASANAYANASVWDATASATATGIDQSVDAWAGERGLHANALVDNSGSVVANAFAQATGQDDADAWANATGVEQFVEDANTVDARVINHTSAYIYAHAQASAYAIDDDADAEAFADGVDQEAEEFDLANLLVDNSGYIQAGATAYALSHGDDASADASATGIEQWAGDGGVANLTILNSPTGVIGAYAKAFATATGGPAWNADASASAWAAWQSVDDVGVGNLTITNSNIIQAYATGYAFGYDAFADGTAWGAWQSADNVDVVNALITNNTGASIYAHAKGSAYGFDDVSANASAWAAGQDVGNIGVANLTINNSGNLLANAQAFASASEWDADADAWAWGGAQTANNVDVLNALITNSAGAVIDAYAYATAIGNDDAFGFASAWAAYQWSNGATTSFFEILNSGMIEAEAGAKALAAFDDASATASAWGAFQGSVNGTFVDALVNNDVGGVIRGYAHATATAYADPGGQFNNANAEAYAWGIEQRASNLTLADLEVNNSGNVYALADANALSNGDDAWSTASAWGVDQNINSAIQGTGLVTNNVGANIWATAYADAVAFESATADAWAIGVEQNADNTTLATFNVQNFGYIGGYAEANATGEFAEADAIAFGIRQDFDDVLDANAIVFNGGLVQATALANANGSAFGEADAWAAGIEVNAWPGLVPFDIDVENKGRIEALASAYANDEASAAGIGIYAFSEFAKQGTIENSGQIYASAFANAGFTEIAQAVGIWDPSKVNNMHIINSGLINAYAEVSGGATNISTAVSTGIRITAADSEEGGGFITDNEALTTITNLGGTIWAGYSEDGGATLERGNAINLAGVNLDIENNGPAPNSVLIELKGELAEGSPGSGHVFGDIVLDNHDTVNVTDGKTFFNGIMYSPYQAFASESGLEGNEDNHLNIFNDGDLVLCQTGWTGACDPADWAGAGPNEGNPQFDPQETNFGPAYVLIDHVTIGDIEGNGSSGTITYQLTPIAIPGDPTLGFAGIGTYPQVGANRIDLIDNSIFRAWYLPGLYGNQTVYKGVMVADEINGTFESVVDNSFLLKSNLDYDPAEPLYPHENIDLVVERTPFNKVGGSQNQKSVGGGLEGAYEHLLKKYGVGPLPDDKFAGLLGDLLLIDNKKDYLLALDQLSGAQIAQGLQSIVWSLRPLNESITDRMDCFVQVAGVEPLKLGGGSTPSTGCFTPGQIQAWGRVFGGWNNADGDINAPSYDEDQFAFWGGLDYAFNPNWYVGVAGGYFDANMSFGRFGGVPGGSFDYDGGQLAIYGGWDNCEWYNRAIISWGWYDGDSNRLVAVKASPVDPSGSFDADAIAFYNEAGYRFLVGSHSQVTPYVGIGASNGEINSFTEKDPFGTGANLKIHDSDGDSLFTVLGVRWNGAWGNFRPQLGLGWEHQFEDTAQTITASFAQDKSGTKFKVTGSDLGDDAVLVEAGGTYLIGPSAELTFGYMGRWYENYDSQWVTGRFTWKFGAAAPAAAAPAPHEPLKIGTE